MAERRMFAKTIIDSDAFIDMPLSTQALYFHLSMRADDDGFINNPKKIQRMIGCSDDDLKVLIAKRFILPFDSGVVVIKHWKIHNYIQKDRYRETVYKEEKAMLDVKENNAYTLLDTPCIHTVSNMDTQVSIGKSKVIDSIEVIECSIGGGNGSKSQPVENSVENSQLKLIGGELGKGVVFLTDEQLSDLIDKLGFDAFNHYVAKLADFIIDNDAKVKSHYHTILKWHKEDSGVSV